MSDYTYQDPGVPHSEECAQWIILRHSYRSCLQQYAAFEEKYKDLWTARYGEDWMNGYMAGLGTACHIAVLIIDESGEHICIECEARDAQGLM